MRQQHLSIFPVSGSHIFPGYNSGGSVFTVKDKSSLCMESRWGRCRVCPRARFICYNMIKNEIIQFLLSAEQEWCIPLPVTKTQKYTYMTSLGTLKKGKRLFNTISQTDHCIKTRTKLLKCLVTWTCQSVHLHWSFSIQCTEHPALCQSILFLELVVCSW